MERPTIFLRDEQGRLTNRINPETMWVFTGESGTLYFNTGPPHKPQAVSGPEWRNMRYLDEFRYFFRHDTTGCVSLLWRHRDGREAHIDKADFEEDQKLMRQHPKGQAGLTTALILAVLVGIVVIWGVFSSFRTVDTGHIGILTSFGKVTGDELQPGLHNINPFTQGITQMSVQIQKDTANADSASSDLQQTTTQVAVNYHLDPAHVFDVYSDVGTNYADILIDPAIQESIKAVTAQFTAVQLVQQRAAAKAALEDALRRRLAKNYIVVDNVNLTNFGFSDAFNRAIEAKQVASQQVLTEQQKLDALRISAQRQVVEADNQAQAQIAAAQGDAQSNIIRAKASAQAQRLQQSSLTPLFVQYQAILKWNGALPAYNGGTGPIPFVTVPITR